jgi:hypothetical protein
MFATIDGGPLEAKHHAAVVIHPIIYLSGIPSRCLFGTYPVAAQKTVEQRGQGWLTNDIVHPLSDL